MVATAAPNKALVETLNIFSLLCLPLEYPAKQLDNNSAINTLLRIEIRKISIENRFVRI
jgi:hypothetical protein